MKTFEDFYNDEAKAIQVMADFLKEKGYQVEFFYNMEGSPTVKITVNNENEGENEEYFAVFEGC